MFREAGVEWGGYKLYTQLYENILDKPTVHADLGYKMTNYNILTSDPQTLKIDTGDDGCFNHALHDKQVYRTMQENQILQSNKTRQLANYLYIVKTYV